ncbi:hypothetical protein KIN20_025170 [Parelaphostrongylus tenuis]|uniref:Uncharacterized protein n=1 Tax=Parelaphostrongylus tenuis TaxID=148309 RepID=A0AAD5N8H9_PARTN|nr:hypothetical protein KIN20_025170 [Parelaphostrongylus tenuis]
MGKTTSKHFWTHEAIQFDQIDRLLQSKYWKIVKNQVFFTEKLQNCVAASTRTFTVTGLRTLLLLWFTLESLKFLFGFLGTAANEAGQRVL